MSAATSTLLLVEDNPDDVLLTRRAFARAGLGSDLRVVEDGESAIAYLAGSGGYADRGRFPWPALLLLDLKLPRLSGFEVLAWLRAQPVLRRMPVVVLTSSEEARDVNQAFDLGANSYLVKPLRPDHLAEMLRAFDLYWLTHNRSPDTRVR